MPKPSFHGARRVTGAEHLTWAAADVLWWVTALMALAWVPHPDLDHLALLPQLAVLGLLGGALHVGMGCLLSAYLVRHERGSFDEVAALVSSTLGAGAVLALGLHVTPALPPVVGVAGAAVAVSLMLLPRLGTRVARQRRASARHLPDLRDLRMKLGVQCS